MNIRLSFTTLMALATAATSLAQAPSGQTPSTDSSNPDWYKMGLEAIEARANRVINNGKAKNVILFIGDGMGISTLTASRILEGQLHGKAGEEHTLSFEHFPYTALVKTYNTNVQVPDSAGTATAMVTGVKTKAGVLSLDQRAMRAVCGDVNRHVVPTILEKAEDHGLATGIVSSARITHATPAATYAHSPDRNWENDSKLTAEAKTSGCIDIAKQMVYSPHGDGIDVILGGGRAHFFANTMADREQPNKKGKRKDGLDLMSLWKSHAGKREVVTNRKQLMQLGDETEQVLGLFSSSHLPYHVDRNPELDPSLTELTKKAITMLKRKGGDKGFFLMVESGRVDHAHHAGNAYRAFMDAIELASAVKKAQELVSTDDTLILVTADHSHVMTMSGYPSRGNPILGKVKSVDGNGKPSDAFAKDALGLPYTTISYANGPGYTGATDQQPEGPKTYPLYPATGHKGISMGRPDLTEVDTTAPSFMQEATVPMTSETHSGEDVALYAIGPQAHLVSGLIEQNVIYHLMNRALFKGTAAKAD